MKSQSNWLQQLLFGDFSLKNGCFTVETGICLPILPSGYASGLQNKLFVLDLAIFQKMASKVELSGILISVSNEFMLKYSLIRMVKIKKSLKKFKSIFKNSIFFQHLLSFYLEELESDLVLTVIFAIVPIKLVVELKYL